MRKIAPALAVSFGIGALMASCGSDDSDGDGGGQNAAAICNDVEALLNEKNALVHCPAGGEVLGGQCRSGVRAKPSCAAEVRALYDCALVQPDADWGCHDVGEYPALETAACSPQNTAVGQCFGD